MMTSSISSTPRGKANQIETSETCRSGTRGATPTSTTSIYTSFDDLTNCYDDSSNIDAIIEELNSQVHSNENWRVHFDAIESLRVLNKYYSNETRIHLSKLIPFLQRSLESLRSNLSKNTLMLIKEVFQYYRYSHTSDNFLDEILPIILEKAVSEKGFLKNEAKAALKALEKTGCNNNVVQVLCNKSFDKNGIISEVSFQSLTEIIQEAKENLTDKISQEYIGVLFSTIAKSIDGKRAVNKRMAKNLCEQLKDIFSENGTDFELFLKEKLKIKESEIKIISEALKKNSKCTKPDFSCFIKTKKLKQESDKSSNIPFTLIAINLKKQ